MCNNRRIPVLGHHGEMQAVRGEDGEYTSSPLYTIDPDCLGEYTLTALAYGVHMAAEMVTYFEGHDEPEFIEASTEVLEVFKMLRHIHKGLLTAAQMATLEQWAELTDQE